MSLPTPCDRLLVEILGEPAGRLHPGLQHDGVVFDAAPAQRGPRVEQREHLALGVPEIGEPRPLRHFLQRLIHAVGAGEPRARIEDLAEQLRDRRILVLAGLHVAADRLRHFERRRPKFREGLVRLVHALWIEHAGKRHAGSRFLSGRFRHVGEEVLLCGREILSAAAPQFRHRFHVVERRHVRTPRPAALPCLRAAGRSRD